MPRPIRPCSRRREMTPDVNVLVAASRADHVHHHVAHRWLTQALRASATGSRLDVMPMVIVGFLRLVTHERVFPDPTPIDAAVEFIDALLSAPGVDVLALGASGRPCSDCCLTKI